MECCLTTYPGRKIPAGTVRYRPAAPTEPSRAPLWWFTPDRPETRSRRPDPTFLHKLERDFPGLIVVNWHPIRQRWQVWTRSPRIKTPYCRGWLLLFFVEDREGGYLPLDERVLFQIWDRSQRKWGDGVKYFNRIVAEMKRDQMLRDKYNDQECDDRSSDYWNHTKIQVSMRGKSSGNKFVKHHAGD